MVFRFGQSIEFVAKHRTRESWDIFNFLFEFDLNILMKWNAEHEWDNELEP